MTIKSFLREYEVEFVDGFSFVDELAELKNKLVIVDKKVYSLYKNVFDKFDENDIYLIEAVETNKNIDTALKICERLTELPSKRNTTLISFGGGIIQDITGFCACILYRGIQWIYIPTTLLAQADSCIGSKTSLNYLKYKNLLGTFFPPSKLYINLDFLSTLTETDYMSGLGEVIKFNIMSGEEYYNKLKEEIALLIDRNYSYLQKYVVQSLNFKKKFIEEDEFDLGNRILLNFGHTFGHAIETVTDYAIPHGQAISIGMVICNIISKNRGLLSENMMKNINDLCKKAVSVDVDCSVFDYEKLTSPLKNDKKRTGDKFAAVLLKNSFEFSRIQDLTDEEIKLALSEAEMLFIKKEAGVAD